MFRRDSIPGVCIISAGNGGLQDSSPSHTPGGTLSAKTEAVHTPFPLRAMPNRAQL